MSKRIRALMHPLEDYAAVGEDEMISHFLRHQTLSLLVTRGGRTIGLLRLSDLFDELARQIMTGDCAPEND